MGDLAMGKSTFANILSKRYDTNVFFKDSIKEVLGDTIGFSNREENKKYGRKRESTKNSVPPAGEKLSTIYRLFGGNARFLS